MPRTYRLVVGPAEAGKRLDRYLLGHLPESISRSMIQRSIRQGAVTVDERPAKAHRPLRAGEVVVARCDELGAAATPLTMEPQDLPLDIVYEDATMLVINKPSGLVTHPAPGHWDGTLVNAVLWHLKAGQGTGDRGQGQPDTSHVPDPVSHLTRAGIVHRLDKDTSGLLLVAKTDAARFNLSKQLKDRTISRRYLALVEGQVALDTGTVNAAIGRDQRHRKEMTVRHLGGRSAVTHYRVLKRCGPAAGRTGGEGPEALRYTVLEVSLETGRTHQIRVHMAHVGHPVLGDTTYGHRSAGFWVSVGIRRHLLHAARLTVRHPTTKQPLTFTAPPPQDMVSWLAGVKTDLL